jgi:hypothetical protein
VSCRFAKAVHIPVCVLTRAIDRWDGEEQTLHNASSESRRKGFLLRGDVRIRGKAPYRNTAVCAPLSKGQKYSRTISGERIEAEATLKRRCKIRRRWIAEQAQLNRAVRRNLIAGTAALNFAKLDSVFRAALRKLVLKLVMDPEERALLLSSLPPDIRSVK